MKKVKIGIRKCGTIQLNFSHQWKFQLEHWFAAAAILPTLNIEVLTLRLGAHVKRNILKFAHAAI